MRTLWPPEAPSVQDGGDGLEGASETAQDPGPLLAGPAAALWIGSGAFFVIFLVVLMLVIRGRVIAPARRRALADAQFFEPAGEGAEIDFDEPVTTKAADEPKTRKDRNIRKDRKPSVELEDMRIALERDAGREDERAAPAGQAQARGAPTPALRAKKAGSPFAGLFKKKSAEERPFPEQAADEPPTEAAFDAGAERDTREEERFAQDGFDERRAAEYAGAGPDPAERRAEWEREEACRRAEEEAERARLADDERERLYRQARESEFERRKTEAALEQRLQSISGVERRLAERVETLEREEDALGRRLDAALEARFERLADRLNAKIDSLTLAGGPPRANDDRPDVSRKLAAELSDIVRREVAALRVSTQTAIETLSQRIDAGAAPSPSPSADLAQEIARLNTLISGRASATTAGRVQLSDLVRSVLPAERYVFARQLSTGRTADCLIYAPGLAAPIAVDARFPVEAFDRYARDREHPDREARARDEYRRAVLRHVVDIAENLTLPGETVDFAVMFVPSEAILNDLYAEFGDVIQDSYRARVWIVSPTSLMASLHMMTALAGGAPDRSGAEAALREEIEALWARLEALENSLNAGEIAEEGAAQGRIYPFRDDYGDARVGDRGDLADAPEEPEERELERLDRDPADLRPFPLRSRGED